MSVSPSDPDLGHIASIVIAAGGRVEVPDGILERMPAWELRGHVDFKRNSVVYTARLFDPEAIT